MAAERQGMRTAARDLRGERDLALAARVPALVVRHSGQVAGQYEAGDLSTYPQAGT